MNLVFWLIVIIGCFLLWFILRKLFEKIGGFIIDKYDETKDILEKEDDEKEEKNE